MNSESSQRKYARFTDEEDAYIRKQYPMGRIADIAEHLQRTKRAVVSRVHNLGIKKIVKGKRVSKVWTPELREVAGLMYPDMDTVDLAAFLGVTVHMLKDEAQRQKVLKSDGFRKSLNTQTLRNANAQFKPGQRPWNEGISDPEHHMHGRGHYRTGLSPKASPIGTIREHPRQNGKKRVMYRDIKVAHPSDWRPLHQYHWEQHHGKPVPPKHSIVFRDGDHDNYGPENLLCLTFEELSMCSTQNLPYDVHPLVKRHRALNRAIKAQEKALKQSQKR